MASLLRVVQTFLGSTKKTTGTPAPPRILRNSTTHNDRGAVTLLSAWKVHRRADSIQRQSIWDVVDKKWHWCRFSPSVAFSIPRSTKTVRNINTTGKSKAFPLQTLVWPRGWVEVELYSSMTAELEGGEWSAARPGRTLPPGKTRYPLYGRLGGPQGRSGRAKNLAPPGFDSRTVQPVVSRYTD